MSKVAIVTGATKGIGKSVAERLLREGWQVIITYSTDTQNAVAVHEAFDRIAPGKAHLLQADISDMNTSITAIDDFLNAQNLFPDAIIFNAGLTDRSDFLDIDPENWNRVFNANVNFPVFLIQKLYPRIREGASLVFTGSLMGIHPHSVSLAYGVTKASVHALVKNMVKFLTPKKIRVNAVAPGFVDTEWQKTKPAAIRENINRKLASGRFCSPEELTDVYMLLINNQYMNGQIVVCDGGYSYQ
ncbi:MAG: NAD(P)-dependent oxidoreductase [Bacteroidetes bacterium]|nr:NAD(P)-dependent oxidoreductase [Bacteroidota bacterium]